MIQHLPWEDNRDLKVHKYDRKKSKEKKITRNGLKMVQDYKHRLHPFSQNISGKLAAPLFQETGEYCLRLYIHATMKGKLPIHMPIHVLMAILWPKNTQIKFMRKNGTQWAKWSQNAPFASFFQIFSGGVPRAPTCEGKFNHTDNPTAVPLMILVYEPVPSCSWLCFWIYHWQLLCIWCNFTKDTAWV